LLTTPPLKEAPVIFADTAVPGTIVYEACAAKRRTLSGVTVYGVVNDPEAYPVEPYTVRFPPVEDSTVPEMIPVVDINSPGGKFDPVKDITFRSLSDEAVT
jgi:hypothetical protein